MNCIKCCFLILVSVVTIKFFYMFSSNAKYFDSLASESEVIAKHKHDDGDGDDDEVIVFNSEKDDLITNDYGDTENDLLENAEDKNVDENNETTKHYEMDSVTKINLPNNIHNIDIVIELNGELGNHLFKIAMGKAIQYQSEEYNYPFNFTFHYLGQGIGKSITPAKELSRCFPSFHGANFTECNVPSYKNILNQQNSLYEKDYDYAYLSANSAFDDNDSNGIKEMLNFVNQSINEEKTIPFHQLQTILDDNDILPISIPFILADRFCHLDLINKYHKRLQSYFEIDSTWDYCCKQKPEIDETVVHIRGFITEMPRVGKRAGFVELNPDKIANVLLKHLQPGDKVVLIGRFTSTLQPYKEALEERELNVRIITGQSGVQDFCFLMSTTKEIVGMISSTYAYWASMLSTSVKKVILYKTSKNTYEIPPMNDDTLNRTFHFPVIDN